MKDSELMHHIATSLRSRRKAAGYKSVATLCEKLNDVNPKRYYEYESGRTPMPIDVALQVADACSCTLDELMGSDASSTSISIAKEEIELLECYKSLDSAGRQTVPSVAKYAVAAMQLEKGASHE